jgi:hypothetical protein
MSYVPSPPPFDIKQLPEYLQRELRRISEDLADQADSVFYRTMPAQSLSLSVSNGSSANWKVAGNVLLISTSVTQTFTGLQRGALDAMREVVFMNVGSGVAVLKSQAAESSASNRFALVVDYQLSANAAATLWRDPFAFRWRGLSKT